jgi:hypothetical protein
MSTSAGCGHDLLAKLRQSALAGAHATRLQIVVTNRMKDCGDCFVGVGAGHFERPAYANCADLFVVFCTRSLPQSIWEVDSARRLSRRVCAPQRPRCIDGGNLVDLFMFHLGELFSLFSLFSPLRRCRSLRRSPTWSTMASNCWQQGAPAASTARSSTRSPTRSSLAIAP